MNLHFDLLDLKLIVYVDDARSLTRGAEKACISLAMQQMKHLRCDMQDFGQGIKGHVRVFANTTSITEYLPRKLAGFLTRQLPASARALFDHLVAP